MSSAVDRATAADGREVVEIDLSSGATRSPPMKLS